MSNSIILRPEGRLAVALYIRPMELESVLHLLKPTLTLSPTGLVFLNLTLSPHSKLGQTQSEISVTLKIESAILGYCSYQPKNFSASDNVVKLIPNFKMNKYVALFLVTILNLENYRYNYGRKASQTRLKTLYIKLPERNGKPDFEFMETFIQSLPYSRNL